jgi:hypothetical protein
VTSHNCLLLKFLNLNRLKSRSFKHTFFCCRGKLLCLLFLDIILIFTSLVGSTNLVPHYSECIGQPPSRWCESQTSGNAPIVERRHTPTCTRCWTDQEHLQADLKLVTQRSQVKDASSCLHRESTASSSRSSRPAGWKEMLGATHPR